MTIEDAFKAAWPDGPSSNPTPPNKAMIRAVGKVIDTSIEGAALGLVRKDTWAALLAQPGTRAGQPGEVTADAATHTDPVVGGTVLNKGSYSWSTSPVGWKRVGDLIDAAVVAGLQSTEIVGAGLVVSTNTLGSGSPTVSVPASTSAEARTGASTSSAITPETARIAADTRITDAAEGDPEEPINGVIAYDPVTGKEIIGANADGRLRISEGLELNKSTQEDDPIEDVVRLPTSIAGFFHRLLGYNRHTGKLAIGPLDTESVIRLKTQIGVLATGFGSSIMRSKVTYCAGAGQSLSLGDKNSVANIGAAAPVISNIRRTPYSWMFNTGMRGVESAALSSATLLDFVPGVEDWVSPVARGMGETQGSGLMAQLHRLDRLNSQLAQMLYRTHASGGKRVDQLDKAGGQNPFINGKVELQQAIAIAATYGLLVEMPAIFWTQGEQDRGDGTTKAAYIAAMLQLIADYRTDYGALLPVGSPDILMFIDQLACGTGANAGSPIQIAHYELARDNPTKFVLVTPKYIFPFLDGVHIGAASTALLGEYHAKVFHKVCRLGQTWKGLVPISAVRTGSNIIVTFNLPVGPLVLDTTTLPAATNYGFEYVGANITSVTVTDAAAGQVTIALDASVGGTLRLAYNGAGRAGNPGAWSNLRDSDDTPSITQPGRLLFNWAATFEETVA